jgi:hypothetical protein
MALPKSRHAFLYRSIIMAVLELEKQIVINYPAMTHIIYPTLTPPHIAELQIPSLTVYPFIAHTYI